MDTLIRNQLTVQKDIVISQMSIIQTNHILGMRCLKK